MRIMKVKYGKRSSAEAVNGFCYCGRAFGGFDDSPLGNPYKAGYDGTFAEVMQMYEQHLRQAIANNNRYIIDALAALTHDSVLGCWCINKNNAGSGLVQCHCDIIAKVWEENHGSWQNAET